MTGRICYLLCFRDPATGAPARYRHAGHYLGSTLAGRLEEHVQEHREGRSGAVLPAAARAAGLDFKVTRTWPGGRLKERQLKSRSGARYCPDCSPDPEPGTAPRRPGATYLTRRQRAERQGADRRPLWELERTAVPVPPHACGTGCTCAAIDEAVTRILQDAGIEPRQEDQMFGRQAREAARERQRQQAEADRLFAIADQLADQTERPNYQHEITTERAARIRERISEDLVHDARAQAQMQVPEPALQGDDLDAEADRLAEMFPEPGRDAELAAHLADAQQADAPYTQPYIPQTRAEQNAEMAAAGWYDHVEPRPEPDPEQMSAWDRYVTSQPGSHEHKAAYVDMHREAGGEGFADPDPDRGYLMEHGYQTDADRWAMPGDYRGAPAGSAEADWPGPEPGPDSARWGPDLVTGVPARGGACASPGCDCDYGHPDRQQAPESAPAPDPLPRVLEPRESAAAAPDPTRLPDGTVHPNPLLAEQGWATQGGWYVRQPEHQLEAG